MNILLPQPVEQEAVDLQVIARTGGGFDNVDVQAATDNIVISFHVPQTDETREVVRSSMEV